MDIAPSRRLDAVQQALVGVLQQYSAKAPEEGKAPEDDLEIIKPSADHGSLGIYLCGPRELAGDVTARPKC